MLYKFKRWVYVPVVTEVYIVANSDKEALEFHAKRKQLPLDLFISMFRVEKIEENETRSIKN